jgi:hypothetical protein
MRMDARKTSATLLVVLLASMPTVRLRAWSAQGHRLVALIASARLTPLARQNVTWLLGSETLADVSSWADRYLDGNYQTFYWHFLNIPPGATSYDRDRDCPRQPTVAAGSSADRWRDCAVERILYNRDRLTDLSLDRADRSVALKFLVHIVGDLHQPFHALGVERGGNGIPVSAFGSENCSQDPARPIPCNLHGIWDGTLIAHRHLDDRQYLAALVEMIRRNGWERRAIGGPDAWAMQSHGLAKAALLPPHGNVDEAYYDREISVVDERLALAGLRLASLLNDSLTAAPPVTR